jgi:hypothetical protein
MFSDRDIKAGKATPARGEVRLRMKPDTAVTGYIDGAWWPRSSYPPAEFPGLILAMSSWVGPIIRVAYHVDDWERTGRELMVEGWTVKLAAFGTLEANTVIVTGSNRRRTSLLVVPPDTPGDVARAVLRTTAGSDAVRSVAEILSSNGVRLGQPFPR